MTNQHPITPPPELVQQWDRDAEHQFAPHHVYMARCAAQWGADMELEACCEWMKLEGHEHEHTALRNTRRPKPPSLKEQALALLDKAEDPSWDIIDFSIVRQALKELPE